MAQRGRARHHVDFLARYDRRTKKAYANALKAEGILKMRDDDRCKWTEIEVAIDSLADRLLKPLTKYRKVL